MASTSSLNLFSNICAALFLGIIVYCCFQSGISLFSLHPILLTLGWLLCLTTAVNSITPGDLASEWLPIKFRVTRHWVIVLFASAVVYTGFFTVYYIKNLYDIPHFVSWHAQFGLASVVLMSGAMMGGLGALYSNKIKILLPPVYMKTIHASAGLTAFALGVVTLVLSLYTEWWTFGDNLRNISVILIVGVALSTFVKPVSNIGLRLNGKLHVN